MKILKRFCVVLIAALLLAIASACAPRDDRINIVLMDSPIDSRGFHNALARLIIENAFEGYRVSFLTGSTAMTYESLKNGDIHLSIENWTGNFPTFEEDVKNGDVIIVGVLSEDSRQGLYVPRYVIEGDPSRGIAPMAPTLRYVWDLPRYAHVFPDDENPAMGRIYGGIPGWLADRVLYNKFHYRGLNRHFTYRRLGSESSLFASLMSAYNLGIGWVGYLYEPTWIVGRLDMVLLEDAPFEPVGFLEGRTAFDEMPILIIAYPQFPQMAPEIYAAFRNFQTGRVLISEALAHLYQTRSTHEETAIWFMRTHDHLIDQWLPPENARRLREYLSQR